MEETTLTQLESMFLALGDKTRLRLLALMADGPVAVGFLADRLNESQPKVSRHLAYLRNTGMVTASRDGKWIYYGIKYPVDAAQRQILERLIASIAVMRVDGRDVFLSESTVIDEPGDDIYQNTDMSNTEEDITFVDDRPGNGQMHREELDIFLL